MTATIILSFYQQILGSLMLVIFLAMPGVVFAQVPAGPAGLDQGLDEASRVASSNKLKADGSAKQLLLRVINFILGLVGTLAVLLLIIAGVMFITSVGEPDKAAKAKHLILYVVIGLIIIMFSAIIVNTILKEVLA